MLYQDGSGVLTQQVHSKPKLCTFELTFVLSYCIVDDVMLMQVHAVVAVRRLLCFYVWTPVGLQVSWDFGNSAGLSCVCEHNLLWM